MYLLLSNRRKVIARLKIKDLSESVEVNSYYGVYGESFSLQICRKCHSATLHSDLLVSRSWFVVHFFRIHFFIHSSFSVLYKLRTFQFANFDIYFRIFCKDFHLQYGMEINHLNQKIRCQFLIFWYFKTQYVKFKPQFSLKEKDVFFSYKLWRQIKKLDQTCTVFERYAVSTCSLSLYHKIQAQCQKLKNSTFFCQNWPIH